MSRGLIFLLVVLVIGGLIEWYSYRALKSKWNNYSKWFRITLKSAFFLFLGLSILSIILMMTAGPYLPRYINNFFFGFVMINFFVKIAFTIFLLLDDLRRLVVFTKRKIVPAENDEQTKITRSDFLVKAGIIAAAVPAISYPLGMFVGPYNYKVRKENLKLTKLPASFKGLKMIQISDIHAGSFYDKEAVLRGIELINQEKPDVVFFTGDLVNDSAAEMDNYMDVFSKIHAPLGVYSVLGNHDYGDYRSWNSDQEKENNLSRVKEIHAELGWKLLLDEHIYLERNEEKIAIIGVENWGSGFHQIGDLSKAYQGVDAPVKILLSHDPTHWDEQVKKDFKDIDLTLSGHTHGAQMGIETHGFKWSPISLRYDKWAGLYQEGEQYLYVNRGYGFLGYPGRIGIWPEITVIELS